MKKVRDIIRYSHATDLSERQIARALGISRTVVARTLCAFQASGLEYDAVEQMPDSQLQKSLGPEKAPQDGSRYAELNAAGYVLAAAPTLKAGLGPIAVQDTFSVSYLNVDSRNGCFFEPINNCALGVYSAKLAETLSLYSGLESGTRSLWRDRWGLRLS